MDKFKKASFISNTISFSALAFAVGATGIAVDHYANVLASDMVRSKVASFNHQNGKNLTYTAVDSSILSGDVVIRDLYLNDSESVAHIEALTLVDTVRLGERSKQVIEFEGVNYQLHDKSLRVQLGGVVYEGATTFPTVPAVKVSNESTLPAVKVSNESALPVLSFLSSADNLVFRNIEVSTQQGDKAPRKLAYARGLSLTDIDFDLAKQQFSRVSSTVDLATIEADASTDLGQALIDVYQELGLSGEVMHYSHGLSYRLDEVTQEAMISYTGDIKGEDLAGGTLDATLVAALAQGGSRSPFNDLVVKQKIPLYMVNLKSLAVNYEDNGLAQAKFTQLAHKHADTLTGLALDVNAAGYQAWLRAEIEQKTEQASPLTVNETLFSQFLDDIVATPSLKGVNLTMASLQQGGTSALDAIRGQGDQEGKLGPRQILNNFDYTFKVSSAK